MLGMGSRQSIVVSPIQVGDNEALLAQSFPKMIQLAHLVGIICDTERRSQ